MRRAPERARQAPGSVGIVRVRAAAAWRPTSKSKGASSLNRLQKSPSSALKLSACSRTLSCCADCFGPSVSRALSVTFFASSHAKGIISISSSVSSGVAIPNFLSSAHVSLSGPKEPSMPDSLFLTATAIVIALMRAS